MDIVLSQAMSFLQTGRRDYQEDSRFPDTDVAPSSQRVFVICDGVGGQSDGKLASETVATTLGDLIAREDLSRDFGAKELGRLVGKTDAGLQKIIAKSGKSMATTLALICFTREGALCGHIGDSRVYHVRPGVGILYRSDDHSLVNMLVHSGSLTPEKSIDHPRSNVITQCLGASGGTPVRPALETLLIEDIEGGDFFFICSDGVFKNISEERLYEILNDEGGMIDDKIKEISSLSYDSDDNNTAWLIRVEEVGGRREETEPAEGEDVQTENGTTLALEVRQKEVVMMTPEPSAGIKETLKNFLNKLF